MTNFSWKKIPIRQDAISAPSGANRQFPLVPHSKNINDVRITTLDIHTLIRKSRKKEEKRGKNQAFTVQLYSFTL